MVSVCAGVVFAEQGTFVFRGFVVRDHYDDLAEALVGDRRRYLGPATTRAPAAALAAAPPAASPPDILVLGTAGMGKSVAGLDLCRRALAMGHRVAINIRDVHLLVMMPSKSDALLATASAARRSTTSTRTWPRPGLRTSSSQSRILCSS
jgi:hypothetical protein